MQTKYLFPRIFRIATALVLMLSLMLSSVGSSVQAQGGGPLVREVDAPGALDVPRGALRARLVEIDFSILSGPQGIWAASPCVAAPSG